MQKFIYLTAEVNYQTKSVKKGRVGDEKRQLLIYY